MRGDPDKDDNCKLCKRPLGVFSQSGSGGGGVSPE